MTLANLRLNYKVKFQILNSIDPETVIEFISILPNDSVGFDLVEVFPEEFIVTKVGEGDDFFDLDVRVKLSFYHDGTRDIESLVENTLEIDLDGFFSVVDWELYGWGEEPSKKVLAVSPQTV